MNQICALDIRENFAIALQIKKTQKGLVLLEQDIIDKDELQDFLKDKKNLYFSIEQFEEVDEQISLTSIIKNDAVIRGSILLKISEQASNRKIIFNYYELPQRENNENIIYQANGVYEKEYTDELYITKDLKEIEVATTSKFALFGISQECMKEKSYFSIYTSSNKIITIVVHDGEIIYNRTNTVIATNANLRIINIVAEINQTINYVKQQFRDIEIQTVVFSGTITIDDTIAEHLYVTMPDYNIAVLYPNTFIKGLKNEEAQTSMIALGSIFVPKKFQFIPMLVLSLKQFELVTKTLLAFSFAVLFTVSLFALGKFYFYYESVEKFETTKAKLATTVKQTHTYSKAELQRALDYLNITQKYLQHHPVDAFYTLKPIFDFQKIENFDWKFAQSEPELKVTFHKSFESLEELYLFEKKFYAILDEIKKSSQLSYSKGSNYAGLDFSSSVTLGKGDAPVQPPPAPRRRRG